MLKVPAPRQRIMSEKMLDFIPPGLICLLRYLEGVETTDKARCTGDGGGIEPYLSVYALLTLAGDSPPCDLLSISLEASLSKLVTLALIYLPVDFGYVMLEILIR